MMQEQPHGNGRPSKIIVVFRNDDLSAISNFDHEAKIFGLFERHGVPQTLAIVPRVTIANPHDPHGAGERLLSENPKILTFLGEYAGRTGSEIALHGYTHRANRFSDPSRREYAEFKYLPLEEQEEMIRGGVEIIEKSFGYRPATFVPPWNRWDCNTLIACARNGCRTISAGPYVTTFDGVLAFGANTTIEHFQRDLEAARRSSGQVFLNVLFHSGTLTPRQIDLLVQALDQVTNEHDLLVSTVAKVAEGFADELRTMNEAGRNIISEYQVPDTVRARAWIYLSLSEKFCKFSPLNELKNVAKSRYRGGDYTGACALTKSIDDTSTKVVFVGRATVFLVGCVICLLLRSSGLPRFFLLQSLVAAVMAIGGVVTSRRAISEDTRRELMALGFIAALGLLVAHFTIDSLLKLLAWPE